MWYIYGDAVLDRILDVRVAERLSVFLPNLSRPEAGEVHAAAGIADRLPIDFVFLAPVLAFHLDRAVIQPDGRLTDVVTGGDPDCCESVSILKPNLADQELLRLNSWLNRYPMLKVDPLLKQRVIATVNHLNACREGFSEVELLFAAHE